MEAAKMRPAASTNGTVSVGIVHVLLAITIERASENEIIACKE